MAKRLNARVHLTVDEETFVYGPGDSVPAKHAKLIVNPKVWDADEPAKADDKSSDSSDS